MEDKKVKKELTFRKQGNRKIYLRGWKKYEGFENRENGYFSLEDLLELSKGGQSFTVTDAKENDITSEILVDVLKLEVAKSCMPAHKVRDMLVNALAA